MDLERDRSLAFILICTLLSDVFGARPAVASLIGYGVAIPPVYWAQKGSHSALALFIALHFRDT